MDLDLENISKRCRIGLRRTIQSKKLCAREERNASLKKVSLILQKSEMERTGEESQMLRECSEAVEEVQLRWRKRDEAKRRLEEFEEPSNMIYEKCRLLAEAISQSEHLVVYTGAGISTAAKIPDYRGTNGIWTRLQQGKDIGCHDLSLAEPTFTHMALSVLYRKNILKYVVSQNCDGLHLRSGLPRTAVSEVHGNMYVEVCKTCKPVKEYWRLFDVTENTARYSHKTMRKCYKCHGPLEDTIVHFGERGRLQWPLNWSGACKNAKKATTILCLGSSLKVLKKYPWLWQMDKPVKKRPKLYIVNLQWTPKDDCANIKIHGKCDTVMEIVTKMLGIEVPKYERINDPIFFHSTHLSEQEYHTTTQPFLRAAEKVENMDCEEKNEECGENETGYHLSNLNTSRYASQIGDRYIGMCSQSLICDNESNSINSNNEILKSKHRLPQHSHAFKQEDEDLKSNYSFSFDRILHDGNNLNYPSNFTSQYNMIQNASFLSELSSNIFLQQNYQTLLAYYHLSNTLLQQSLFNADLLYYPFQTSLMYSGLHQIITPSTYYVEDHDYATKLTSISTEKVGPEICPKCEFCHEHYQSLACLFYTKVASVFLKKETDDSNKFVVCLCCEYSSDDEENSNDVCEASSEENTSLIEKERTEMAEKEHKSKIQAGWFGKGYRKNRRYKKR